MEEQRKKTRRNFLELSACGFVLGALMVASAGFPFVAHADNPKLKDPIKIGIQGCSSGTQGMFGKFMLEGATMAIEEINANGGILGSKIEYQFRDEQLRPDIAVKNARYFVNDWGADFVVGTDGSGVALAVAQIMPELNRILLITHGSTSEINEDLVYKRGIKNIFNVGTTLYADAIGGAMVAKELAIKRWAMIIPDYAYGHMCLKLFKKTLKELKPDVEFVTETLPKFGTVDFSSHIMKVMAAKPEGIFSAVWGGECVTLVKQAKQYGVFKKIKTWLNPNLATLDTLTALGDDCPEGIWSTTKYFWLYPDTPTNKRYVEAFYKRYFHYPSYQTEPAYAAIYIIKKAIEETKSLDINKLIAAMEGMKLDRPASSTSYIRKEDHQVIFTQPWGQVKRNPKYPIPILTNLKVFPVEKIYRNPPFPPVD